MGLHNGTAPVQETGTDAVVCICLQDAFMKVSNLTAVLSFNSQIFDICCFLFECEYGIFIGIRAFCGKHKTP